MRYDKVEFTSGLSGFGYQAIDERGDMVAMTDDAGFEIPPGTVYECFLTEEGCSVPFERVVFLPKEADYSSLGERIDRIELTPEQEQTINDIIRAVLNTPSDQLPPEILA